MKAGNSQGTANQSCLQDSKQQLKVWDRIHKGVRLRKHEHIH